MAISHEILLTEEFTHPLATAVKRRLPSRTRSMPRFLAVPILDFGFWILDWELASWTQGLVFLRFLPNLGSAEKLYHCESRCHTDLKIMASEEICSDSTPDFPPKCRHFGTLNAIILHLFGLKRVETLALRGFILIQQALI
jgi:hypothetical protein